MKLDLHDLKRRVLAAQARIAELERDPNVTTDFSCSTELLLELVSQLETERGLRVQCAEDSDAHLQRALTAEARYRFVIGQAELLDHGRGQNHWTLTSVVFDQAGEQDLGDKHAEITAAVDAGLVGAKAT